MQKCKTDEYSSYERTCLEFTKVLKPDKIIITQHENMLNYELSVCMNCQNIQSDDEYFSV